MKHKRIDLLKHPVASELLKYKWNTYGLPVFVFNFVLNVLFVILLTATVMLTPLPQREECRGKCSVTVNNCLYQLYHFVVSNIYFIIKCFTV